MTRRQGVFLLTVLALAAAFWWFDLGHWLRLDTLKARQAELATLYGAHPTAVIAGYVAVYVAVTALSLPGAVVLTLAANRGGQCRHADLGRWISARMAWMSWIAAVRSNSGDGS